MDLLPWVLGATLALIAPIAFVMPRLTPKAVQYGVRVPPSRAGHPVFAELEGSYRFGVALSTLIAAAALALTLLGWGEICSILSIPAFLVGALVTYLGVRGRLLRVKSSERWASEGTLVAVAGIGGSAEIPAIWPWLLPSFVLWVAFLAWGIHLYPGLPSMLPTHFNAAGQADTWSPKDPATVFFGSILGGFLLALFTGIVWAIARTRAPLDPLAPRADSLRQAVFRTRMGQSLLVLAAFLQVSLGVADLLTWEVLPPSGPTLFLLLVPVLAGVGVIAAVSYRTGQLGSRVEVRLHGPETPASPGATGRARDDDRLWVGGVLYYNPDDSSVLVPKRFGVGWTLNIASPWSWLIFAVLIALPIAPLLIHVVSR
ncbi:MAG: DUF1648 domain-containing protein [Candidatus Lutacidiplasmatales archaeon]